MNKIIKNNLLEFLEYYHYFHDSYITSINYDISKSKIEMLVDVYWSGTPTLREDNVYETNKTKMKIVFDSIEECNIKEVLPWDYISEIYMKYIKFDGKELICFSSDETEPIIYIVCANIEYEEIKNISTEENDKNE